MRNLLALAFLTYGALAAQGATFAVKVLDCAGRPVTKELEISLTKLKGAGW